MALSSIWKRRESTDGLLHLIDIERGSGRQDGAAAGNLQFNQRL